MCLFSPFPLLCVLFSLTHTEELYKKARAAAEAAVIERNRHFVLASQTYGSLTNSTATHHAAVSAQSHLAQARAAQHRMRTAHAEASIEIFRARNQHLNSRQCVDLHGLHVTEALAILKQLFKKLSNERAASSSGAALASSGGGGGGGTASSLRIITGLNSGRKARLKPAVEVFLKSRGFRYTAMNPGEFKVYLS